MTYLYLYIGPRTAQGDFPIQVSAAGEVTHARLVFPERLLMRTASLLRPGESFAASDEAVFGMYLDQKLFPPAVRALLLRAIVQARTTSRPLQIHVQIDPPELAMFPWEWLTVPGTSPWSPALHNDYGLVRVASMLPPTHVSPPTTSRPPMLRLLLAAAHAEDATLLALRAALHASPGPQMQSELLLTPSAQSLRRAIEQYRPTVLHLIAPLELDAAGQPWVLVAPNDPRSGAWERLDAAALAGLLRGSATMPLVVLNAIGQPGMLNAAGPRLALNLVAQGIPVAVAFHSILTPETSTQFTQVFYTALAEGTVVEAAMVAGRRTLAAEAAQTAWGMPLLAVSVPEWRLPTVAWSPALPRLQPAMARSVGTAAIAVMFMLFLLYRLIAGVQIHTPLEVVAQASLPTLVTFAPSLVPPTATRLPTRTPTLSAYDQARGPVAPPVIPPGPTMTPSPLPPLMNWATYVVAPDDTLATVATRMGSDPVAIARLNRIDIVEPLQLGRGLVVPVYQPAELGTGGLDVKSGRQDLPLVALTFDIEINDTMLYQMLEIMRVRGIHGTFFVTGNWVLGYPDAARAIVAEGHEIGNHSLTHPFFTRIGPDGALNEILATEEIVIQTTGVSTRPFFRFPYGEKNPAMINLLATQGYISYHWTIDERTLDWWLPAIAAGQTNPNGTIILLHQSPATIAALPGWLDGISAAGLTPVPLSQILR